MLRGKKKEEEHFLDLDDRLIVWNEENHSCEIHYVTEVSDESVIVAGRFVAPKELCNVATSSEGRVYIYQAPAVAIQHIESLAKLEQSMVLQQITNYKPEPKENPNLDFKHWALVGLLFVAIIAAAF
ncbi:hypothetical protein J1907_23755 (plasmid) [Lysinibacillus sphaericus]|uniref:LP1G.13 n=1 Tax=Lysinibacillus sphaericus TaxID=1421 RepID=Q7WYK7_LYSSH|nr:hypothetical protein [Lysinibacillus sphaericus]AAP86241.1 LP1G.13 [Lysinibacillus sphaericus]QTB25013.1 hypothetical protein J1907_23755 [Lysinibacillus sphaericus]